MLDFARYSISAHKTKDEANKAVVLELGVMFTGLSIVFKLLCVPIELTCVRFYKEQQRDDAKANIV